jgi:hypothetical protein
LDVIDRFLSQIDWSRLSKWFEDAFKDYIEAARQLADKGWTVPEWMDLTASKELCKLSPKDLDDLFMAEYTKNDCKVLREQIGHLTEIPEMVQWNALLIEIRESLIAGRHLVTVPALLTVLEGYAVTHVLKLPGTNVQKLFDKAGFHRRGGIWAIPAISTMHFLKRLFEESPFHQEPPQFINRYWVMHGRDHCKWTPADAFRLLNALETLRWAFEIQVEMATLDSAMN